MYTTNNGKTTRQTNCLTDPLVAVAQSGNVQGIVWKYMEIKRFLSNVHDIVDLGRYAKNQWRLAGWSLVFFQKVQENIFQQLKANRNLGNNLVRNCPSSIFLICEVHFVVYPTSNMLSQTLHPVAIKFDDLGLVTLGPTKSESLCFLVAFLNGLVELHGKERKKKDTRVFTATCDVVISFRVSFRVPLQAIPLNQTGKGYPWIARGPHHSDHKDFHVFHPSNLMARDHHNAQPQWKGSEMLPSMVSAISWL